MLITPTALRAGVIDQQSAVHSATAAAASPPFLHAIHCSETRSLCYKLIDIAAFAVTMLNVSTASAQVFTGTHGPASAQERRADMQEKRKAMTPKGRKVAMEVGGTVSFTLRQSIGRGIGQRGRSVRLGNIDALSDPVRGKWTGIGLSTGF